METIKDIPKKQMNKLNFFKRIKVESKKANFWKKGHEKNWFYNDRKKMGGESFKGKIQRKHETITNGLEN